MANENQDNRPAIHWREGVQAELEGLGRDLSLAQASSPTVRELDWLLGQAHL